MYLKQSETTSDYPYRKLGSLPWTGNPSGTTPQVWREGLEVAMNIKGSQGRPRIEWVKTEHPLTAISDKSEVHANHNEAQNAALRRRSSACLVALLVAVVWAGNPPTLRRFLRRGTRRARAATDDDRIYMLNMLKDYKELWMFNG